MTGKAEAAAHGADTTKLVAAAVLLAAGIAGFYWLSGESLLLRVIGLLAVAGMAGSVAATTVLGRSFFGFMGNARAEARKVVWPTRAETIQTSLMVLVMVLLGGIFLWLLDMMLGWAMRLLIGHGG